jgi:hypothetical protein
MPDPIVTGGYVLTQHALAAFGIKNRKDNTLYSSLNIYGVVHNANTLYL